MNYCEKHGYYEASTVTGCPVCRTSDAPFITAPASALGAPMQYPPFVPGGVLAISGEAPTIRDLFAMAALNHPPRESGNAYDADRREIAAAAYLMADAMLSERAKARP